jgi:hypothetical protein
VTTNYDYSYFKRAVKRAFSAFVPAISANAVAKFATGQSKE